MERAERRTCGKDQKQEVCSSNHGRKEGSEDPQSPREESPEKAIRALKNRQKHIRGKRQVLEIEDSKSQTTRQRED